MSVLCIRTSGRWLSRTTSSQGTERRSDAHRSPESGQGVREAAVKSPDLKHTDNAVNSLANTGPMAGVLAQRDGRLLNNTMISAAANTRVFLCHTSGTYQVTLGMKDVVQRVPASRDPPVTSKFCGSLRR
jgi:hypothetical protein